MKIERAIGMVTLMMVTKNTTVTGMMRKEMTMQVTMVRHKAMRTS